MLRENSEKSDSHQTHSFISQGVHQTVCLEQEWGEPLLPKNNFTGAQKIREAPELTTTIVHRVQLPVHSILEEQWRDEELGKTVKSPFQMVCSNRKVIGGVFLERWLGRGAGTAHDRTGIPS